MHQRNPVSRAVILIGLVVLYPFYLVISALFVLPIVLFNQVFASRSAECQEVRTYSPPATPWVIVIDALAALATYWVADVLRCTLWMRTAWPEVVPGFGSTLQVHLTMLAMVPVCWPAILAWLGWYQPTWRSFRWKVLNTATAAVLLCLVMSTLALLTARGIFPRIQIGLVAVLLPIVTGVIRGFVDQFTSSRPTPTRFGPAW